MSTNPRARNGWMRAAALSGAALLGACAGPAPGAGHSFAELRLAPSPPALSPAYLKPEFAPPAAAAAGPAAPDLKLATARVLALLVDDGFAVELRREGAAAVLSATRMGPPDALAHEAVCPLRAMRRPDFSSSQLTVRLAQGDRRVAASAAARFVRVDTNLISGDLGRQTCRSNGVLEAAIGRVTSG